MILYYGLDLHIRNSQFLVYEMGVEIGSSSQCVMGAH